MSEEKAVLIELEREIESIQKGVEKLLSGRLKRDTIILLIQNNTVGRPPLHLIEAVLDGMATLEKKYLKPAPVQKERG